MHFQDITIESTASRKSAAPLPDGAQRFDSAGMAGFHAGFGDDAIGGRGAGFGVGEQSFKQFGGDERHIAGDNQVPFGMGCSQRGIDAAHGSVARGTVWDHVVTEAAVALRRADQSDVAGRGSHAFGDPLGDGDTFKFEQSLILSHAGTSAADQYEPGAGRCGLGHEKMIPYARFRQAGEFRHVGNPGHQPRDEKSYLVHGNKKVYICFSVAFALTTMAASPMRAAGLTDSVSAVSSGNVPGSRTTIVVRADSRTGRLVRSVVVRNDALPSSLSKPSPSKPPLSKPSKEISDLVDQAARAHQVDPLLVHSVIKQESNYNAYALSNKGAEGLMQLMPPTARMLGVSNSFDPRENIEAGVKYLKYLQGVFKDDRLALAAYNAGPGAVEKYKQVPPFKETQNYVDQVGKRYETARRERDAEVKASPQTSQRPEIAPVLPEAVIQDKHPRLEQFVDEHGLLSLRTVE